MTYYEVFSNASQRLAAAENPTQSPELDARVLLSHAAGLNHAGLLARWRENVSMPVRQAFEASLNRRLAGEPVAWITGFKEFLGMDFEVGPGLLVPRADTETLVEAALEIAKTKGRGLRIVDVCTGTGCVAIGLAALSEMPWEVWAADVSPLAVATARRNSTRLLDPERQITVIESDLLLNVPGSWDLIVSNPPYLTPQETAERIGLQGWKEPALALDGGGEDGLSLIRRFVLEAAEALKPDGWLVLEAADAQMEALSNLISDSGFNGIHLWKDLAGQRRVIGGRKYRV